MAAEGLLVRAPGRGLVRVAAALSGVVAAWLLTWRADGPLEALLASGVLALAFGQVGLVAHDVAHQQVFRSARRNRRLALLLFDAVVGLSLAWWLEKHDRHHAHPNHDGRDPDATPVVLAFSAEQAVRMRGLSRWIAARQAWLFFPLLLLEGFHLRLQSLRVVLRGRGRPPAVEAAAVALHFAVYGVLLVGWFGVPGALGFAAVHHMAMGLYLALVFAPNHIGMPVLSDGSRLGFLERQLATTRNVRPGWLVDLAFGGLNHQIEHHLFPTLPRQHLRRARALVRAFCRERGLAYREEGLLRAYRELLAGLHAAGAPLREGPKSSAPPDVSVERRARIAAVSD